MDECKSCAEILARQDISEALGKYCLYYDSGEFDRLREIFHPDAAIDFGERFCGTIVQFTCWARSQQECGNGYSHQVTNIVIDGNGALDEKASICAVSALVDACQPTKTVRLVRGFYKDQWLRIDGRWMIKQRIFAASMSVEF